MVVFHRFFVGLPEDNLPTTHRTLRACRVPGSRCSRRASASWIAFFGDFWWSHWIHGTSGNIQGNTGVSWKKVPQGTGMPWKTMGKPWISGCFFKTLIKRLRFLSVFANYESWWIMMKNGMFAFVVSTKKSWCMFDIMHRNGVFDVVWSSPKYSEEHNQ